MRGRWPDTLEDYLDKLDGSAETKERLSVIIETLCGQTRTLAACDQLNIGETRLHQLRATALQAALTAIEPRPAGRPSRAATTEAEEIATLRQEVRDLKRAVLQAEVREEIALILPQARCPAPAGSVTEKKMPKPRVKIQKSR